MNNRTLIFLAGIVFICLQHSIAQTNWSSEWVYKDSNGRLVYKADEKGNTIPNFSRVGYLEGEIPPEVPVVLELEPDTGDNRARIQAAINELASRQTNDNGLKGCLLLKKGRYKVSGQLTLASSGIVIRGEGNDEDGTVIVATGKGQYSLFKIQGSGSRIEIYNSYVKIAMPFVPVGAKKIAMSNVQNFKVGDEIVIMRSGSSKWISDIKMDQIQPRSDGGEITQWTANSYNLYYERKVEDIIGDTLVIDNPVVMEMEDIYGGGFVFKYSFAGRVSKCGVENMLLKSEYVSDTDEDHAWNAVEIEKARDCWVKDVVAKHFGYSAVNITSSARNISVLNCKCLDAKSIITGSRRYSFNCDGQLNLFKNCEASEGRHDFITGAKVAGPNVFTQCKAVNTHADIGPHQRWATGTLYDRIESDGLIFVQDRGNYGSGHGWSGANQVLWNCKGSLICVQSPWVSAKNFAIGCIGVKSYGRHTNRPDGVWEGFNRLGLNPESLYEAQLADRKSASTSYKTDAKHSVDVFTVAYIEKAFLLKFRTYVNCGVVEIFNAKGTKLNTHNISGNLKSLEIPFFGKGIFFIRITTQKEVQTQKIAV